MLEGSGIAFPNTHDLVVLFALIDNRVVELIPLESDLAFLSPLAVASRYPGMTSDALLARQAVEIAGEVRRIIRLKLSLH